MCEKNAVPTVFIWNKPQSSEPKADKIIIEKLIKNKNRKIKLSYNVGKAIFAYVCRLWLKKKHKTKILYFRT